MAPADRGWVIVTGARGLIGYPVCCALQRAGWRVAGFDLYPSTQYVDARAGWQTYGNVLRPETFDGALLCEGAPDWAEVRGLVHLAGVDAKPQSEGSDPWRDWDRLIAVNLTGTANICRWFTERCQPGTSIVLMASLYGLISPDLQLYPDSSFCKPAGYIASKAGVIGLMRYLATMCGPSRIRVNALALGGVGQPETPPGFREAYQRRVPLGRMATVEDAEEAIKWLLSERSSYVTGQTIVVDGGYTAW